MSNIVKISLIIISVSLAGIVGILSIIPNPEIREDETNTSRLATLRDRANSDDAESIDEVHFHAMARNRVILEIQPNKLGEGGRDFRVKRNTKGEGCFVYSPQTRYHGVRRNLIWFVSNDNKAYALNSPSKMLTPSLKWPREDGITNIDTMDVIDYIFSE